jgi:hypothetical protein
MWTRLKSISHLDNRILKRNNVQILFQALPCWLLIIARQPLSSVAIDLSRFTVPVKSWHAVDPGGALVKDAVPPETMGSRPGSVVTGHDREVRGATHNWPSVIRIREGLAGRDILVSSRTSDSCGGPGAVHANQGCQVHGVSSDTLVRLASGLDARCVKKQCSLVGYRRTHDFQP